VLMVAAAVAMLVKPALPSATARILIKTGPEVPISGLPASSGRGGQDLLHTEAELLGSRIVLLPVARLLREQRGRAVVESELEGDVSALRGDLVVVPVPNTTMIQARKFAQTEAEAEQELGLILGSYVEQHATAYSGSTSFSAFFEQETSKAAAGLKDAEDRLQRWRQVNNVVAAEDQFLARLAAVGEFESGLRRAEVDIEAARAQIETLTRDIAALPRESVTSREQEMNPLIARLKGDIATEEAALRDVNRGPVTERLRMEISVAEMATRDASASPLVVKLKGDLATAELALHDLRQRYNDEDRRIQEKLEQIARLQQGIAAAEREAATAANERVQNLRRELTTAQRDVEATARQKIAGLRAQLAAAEREGNAFTRATVALNPLREILNRDLISARARLTTLVSQRRGLRDQLDDARAGLAQMQDKRVEAERLGRDIEMAKAVYLQNTKRLDDVRLTAALRKHQLTNIAVIEPPRATPERLSLRRLALVALLGAVVGLGLGVAAALALEFFNWSLRTPEDVEFYLGVPALATVPALSGATRRPRALPAASEQEAP
jgi:uncharacterized protein involved in exopolysaccharide biosynthesis